MIKEATVPFLAILLEGGLRSLDTLKASCKVNGLASRRAEFFLPKTFPESYKLLSFSISRTTVVQGLAVLRVTPAPRSSSNVKGFFGLLVNGDS